MSQEVANLYFKVMETIFKANETQADSGIKKAKEHLVWAEVKMASVEEKDGMNEIEKDSYNFVKPKFKAEIEKFQNRLHYLQGKPKRIIPVRDRSKPPSELELYYENASLVNKRKLVGSIFPENFTIENDECRTAREI